MDKHELRKYIQAKVKDIRGMELKHVAKRRKSYVKHMNKMARMLLTHMMEDSVVDFMRQDTDRMHRELYEAHLEWCRENGSNKGCKLKTGKDGL